MQQEPKAYFTRIEEKLIDEINNANSIIRIAVAWFTSKKLKEAIITKKSIDKRVCIEIVVDDNKINEKYFFDYAEKFLEVGVVIKNKVKRKFLHNKFIIIDNKLVITGSYNFSNNAKSNSENIVLVYSYRISQNYSRLFRLLTEPDYIDENIRLLFKYPSFSQKLISTYYKFTKKEYQKYKDKIKLGYCFTYPNGMYDEITYESGFIFNQKVKLEPKLNSEFELPIDKTMIKNWILNRDLNFNYESYIDLHGCLPDEEFWKEFSSDMDNRIEVLEKHFKRKEDNTFNAREIEKLVMEKIDIIIENDLWRCNFEPYINKEIIKQLFDVFQPIEKRIDFFGNIEEVLQ